jgi:hypothetical protein
MFNNYLKHLRVRRLSAGSGAMLSMLLTLLGSMPQPVAAAGSYGFELNIERNGHTATVLQGRES